MPPLGLFRNAPALRSPIGFGASDFIELALLLAVVFGFVLSNRIEPRVRRFAARPGWSMALLAVATVALRLALLPHLPVPVPAIYDEFSHLLVGDTLRHFRLANPAHPLPQFFETFFVLQEPSYSSIYPIGQGLALAFGRLVFGHPWAGVVLSMAGFVSLCYWMLRGWVSPAWALVGGVLALFEFGPLSPWMNTYWGGGVSAIAGCLVFGALPRFRRDGRLRDAAVLGAGMGLQLLARPYESVLLLISVLAFLAPVLWRRKELLPIVVATALPAVGLTLLQNKQATGSWTTLPAVLSRYQYGVPTTFAFQPVPVPHWALTAQQEMSYRSQLSYHDTPVSYPRRFWYRLRYYEFFFTPALYLAAAAFLLRLRKPRFTWVALTIVLFALGSNLYPFFFPHYVAALTCLFVLVVVVGLQVWPRRVARLILILAGAHFLFWYGRQLMAGEPPMRPRTVVEQKLSGGKQLVFVRYSPRHIFQDEWVYNDADIDRARIVWARDLGSAENEKLRQYYPDRAAWLLEPDDAPPKLVPYVPEPGPQPVPEPPKPAVTETKPPAKTSKPVLKFEEVPEAK